jgi:hypothetical protein
MRQRRTATLTSCMPCWLRSLSSTGRTGQARRRCMRAASLLVAAKRSYRTSWHCFLTRRRCMLTRSMDVAGHLRRWQRILSSERCFTMPYRFATSRINACISQLYIDLQRETEEKARQPETKLSAIAQTRHTARLRDAKRSRTRNPKPTHGARDRPKQPQPRAGRARASEPGRRHSSRRTRPTDTGTRRNIIY